MTKRRVLAAAALTVIFFPTWSWYFNRLQDRSDEPWGALALVTALFFAARSGWAKNSPRHASPAPLVTAALFGVYFWTRASLPPLAAAGAAALILGQLLCPLCFGRRFLPGFYALLILSLPILPTLQFYLGYPLRAAAGLVAVHLLNGCGFDVQLSGVALSGAGRTVLIDAPCSGVKMLWTISYISAGGLAAYELTGLRAVTAGAAGAVLVFFGNVVRTAALFVLEVRFSELGDHLHEGVGLVIFSTIVIMVMAIIGRLSARNCSAPFRPRTCTAEPRLALGAVLACGVLLSLFLPGRSAQHPKPLMTTAAWPTQHDGEQLERLPLSAREKSFAREFPGEAARFQKTASGDEVIVRLVAAPTRLLHPASHCLKGDGYTVSPAPAVQARGLTSACVLAKRNGETLRVCENIIDQHGRNFSDVSAWYWAAVLEQSQGPWVAYTVSKRVS